MKLGYEHHDLARGTLEALGAVFLAIILEGTVCWVIGAPPNC